MQAGLLRLPHLRLDAHSRATQHVDQRVEVELLDPAAHQLIQAWLRYAEQNCGVTLSQNKRPYTTIFNVEWLMS